MRKIVLGTVVLVGLAASGTQANAPARLVSLVRVGDPRGSRGGDLGLRLYEPAAVHGDGARRRRRLWPESLSSASARGARAIEARLRLQIGATSQQSMDRGGSRRMRYPFTIRARCPRIGSADRGEDCVRLTRLAGK